MARRGWPAAPRRRGRGQPRSSSEPQKEPRLHPDLGLLASRTVRRWVSVVKAAPSGVLLTADWQGVGTRGQEAGQGPELHNLGEPSQTPDLSGSSWGLGEGRYPRLTAEPREAPGRPVAGRELGRRGQGEPLVQGPPSLHAGASSELDTPEALPPRPAARGRLCQSQKPAVSPSPALGHRPSSTNHINCIPKTTPAASKALLGSPLLQEARPDSQAGQAPPPRSPPGRKPPEVAVGLRDISSDSTQPCSSAYCVPAAAPGAGETAGRGEAEEDCSGSSEQSAAGSALVVTAGRRFPSRVAMPANSSSPADSLAPGAPMGTMRPPRRGPTGVHLGQAQRRPGPARSGQPSSPPSGDGADAPPVPQEGCRLRGGAAQPPLAPPRPMPTLELRRTLSRQPGMDGKAAPPGAQTAGRTDTRAAGAPPAPPPGAPEGAPQGRLEMETGLPVSRLPPPACRPHGPGARFPAPASPDPGPSPRPRAGSGAMGLSRRPRGERGPSGGPERKSDTPREVAEGEEEEAAPPGLQPARHSDRPRIPRACSSRRKTTPSPASSGASPQDGSFGGRGPRAARTRTVSAHTQTPTQTGRQAPARTRTGDTQAPPRRFPTKAGARAGTRSHARAHSRSPPPAEHPQPSIRTPAPRRSVGAAPPGPLAGGGEQAAPDSPPAQLRDPGSSIPPPSRPRQAPAPILLPKPPARTPGPATCEGEGPKEGRTRPPRGPERRRRRGGQVKALQDPGALRRGRAEAAATPGDRPYNKGRGGRKARTGVRGRDRTPTQDRGPPDNGSEPTGQQRRGAVLGGGPLLRSRSGGRASSRAPVTAASARAQSRPGAWCPAALAGTRASHAHSLLPGRSSLPASYLAPRDSHAQCAPSLDAPRPVHPAR
ncbi:PREDICTED: collagen alpha-1(I) chain-like [Ceratotherium simum simum]|uniref:Collagen alpha-1(I) chain-like n=1 Tax=Ceratotherium simum simum TaxID=73337 RepID=A0ABM1DKK9_CERSS|nr:PREDICTED: collagen alpha-1(I) chain-like [Ceratotherium simum simum]